MKAFLVHINWFISLFGLMIDTEHAPAWLGLLMAVYFLASCMLLIYYDRKGEMHSKYGIKMMRKYLEFERRFR